jgi:hypothetical protein
VAVLQFHAQQYDHVAERDDAHEFAVLNRALYSDVV